MKLINIFLLTLLTCGLALAAPPKVQRNDRYKSLYQNSPMTDAPPIVIAEAEPDNLPEWVLVGVTKYVDSTRVKLMNIKDRSRVVIPSQEATDMGFEVQKVVQDRNYLENTVVTIKKGNTTGEVRFDPKFLVLKKVAGAAPAAARRVGNNQQRQPAGNNNARNRNRNQPPTPPGVKPSNNRPSSNRAAPPNPSRTPPSPTQPGAIPQPSSPATTASQPSTSKNKKTRRTRYVPRPKK